MIRGRAGTAMNDLMLKPKPCILAVVDDDVQVLHLVRRTLETGGYRVITADSGEAAMDAFEQKPPDLVVLDIMMPGIDGYAVCKHIRTLSLVPIIMLTAIGGDAEQARGLAAGADDYVTKPFSVELLLARVRAVLRRSQATPPPHFDTFRNGSFEIDFARRRVTMAGNEIRLTPTEFRLIQELTLNAGKVLTHTYLLNKVWGPEYKDERQYLHVFIGCLRNKIGLKSHGDGAIINLAGVGYQLTV
jgi:DNA-binding response OmpR family regulator